MKVFKELPKSLLQSAYLSLVPAAKLARSNKPEVPAIVSLTSIPSRLPTLHIVIKSLLNQTHRPKKILLWLNNDLKDCLPARLAKLESDLFEIRYSELNCSHRKLIHSLKAYPDDTIITCDDDLIYNKHWLNKIYSQHQKYPNDVIANNAVQIKIDADGNYSSYKAWREIDPNAHQNTYMSIGAWGILYPPHCLSETVFDQALFLSLTPKADDLWFKGMQLLAGTHVRQSEDRPKEPIPIVFSQKISLKKDNVNKNKNDEQWLNLSKHFELDKILLADKRL